MYRTCAVPDCGVHVKRCEPHHTQHWEDGGPTDIDVLVPLCEHHHDMAHARGWILVLDPGRRLTILVVESPIMTTGPPSDQWR